MSDANSLSVKAYFTDKNGCQEIRRFGVPETASTNYSYLKQRIQNVFSLGSEEITLSWQDSDGDNITISSDEELFEAISECITKEHQVLRIFISHGSKESQDNIEENIHEGVVCDGCDGPIAGSRYKCVICPDYDLCSNCEAKGLHNIHKMIRMSKKAKDKKPEFTWNESKDGTFTLGVKTGLGPGIDAAAWSTGFSPPHGHGRWGGRGRGRGHGRRHSCHPPSWEWNWSYPPPPPPSCPEFGRHFASGSKSSSNCKKESADNQGHEESPCAGGFPWMGQGGAFGFGGSPHPIPENIAAEAEKAAQNAAQIAGKHIAGIMKDIWTAWSGAASAATAASETPGNNDANMDTDPVSEQPKGASVQETEKEANEKKDDDVIIEEPKAASHPHQTDSEEPDVMEVTPLSPDANQDLTHMEPDEWTLLNRDSPCQTPKETHTEPSPAPEVIYPKLDHFSSSSPSIPQPQRAPKLNPTRLSQPPVTPPHPNPRVRVAMEQMQSMGYSNEGGWLTRLLEMKDGNINEVLDLLMPAKK